MRVVLLASRSGRAVSWPYGFQELRELLPRHMAVAAAASAAACVGVIVLATILSALGEKVRARAPIRVTVEYVVTLPPPPTVTNYRVKPALPVHPRVGGIVVPVADETAPTGSGLPSVDEMLRPGDDARPDHTGTGGLIVVAPPAEESLPRTSPLPDQLPQLIRGVAPVYPEFARSAGIEGRVEVEALVGTDGNVEQVRVVRGVELLNRAATDAVRQFHFKPALSGNRPVAVWISVPILFQLSSR